MIKKNYQIGKHNVPILVELGIGDVGIRTHYNNHYALITFTQEIKRKIGENIYQEGETTDSLEEIPIALKFTKAESIDVLIRKLEEAKSLLHNLKIQNMTKIKSLNKEEVNFKNKNQRLKLYNRTFMKHNVESRLFTLQKESINLTLQTAAAALDPSKANLLNLAEAVGDVETCIEIIKHSIPKLQEASMNIKQSKLTSLKNRTDGIDETEKLKPEQKEKPAHEQLSEASIRAEKAIREFSQSIPDKNGFFYFFRYCRKYFTK